MDGNFSSGYYSLGTGDTLVGGYEASYVDAWVEALLPGGTRSVGMDIGLETGESYTITLGSGEQVVGTLAGVTYDYSSGKYVRDSDFIGFTANQDIASIRFDAVYGGWKLIDNFTFGGVAHPASAVPLPAAAWGGMALFGGLGAVRVRRRRRSSAI